jgi:hypothetical protein
MQRRHVEHFGPDLARGPFSPHRIETAAVQIATALAQLRAPLSRADADILAHADFIRRLADRIAPDYATSITVDVGPESGNAIQAIVRTAIDDHSLLDVWLADEHGGGLTGTAPTAVTFTTGTVIETVVPNKHYRVLTTDAGMVVASVSFSGSDAWRLAVARHGCVAYSPVLSFA